MSISHKSFDIDPADKNKEFYLRYYSGGYRDIELGHEFLEFDIRHKAGEDYATLRYANQTNYRDEEMIRKEVYISLLVLSEFMKIVRQSQILLENDDEWPKPLRESKQELEIRSGKDQKLLKTNGRLSLVTISNEKDSAGLKTFYYLIQDIKVFVFSLMSLNFKVDPITTSR